MKALERDPEVRYQDAGEMHRDLERVLHERQPATAAELGPLPGAPVRRARARRAVTAPDCVGGAARVGARRSSEPPDATPPNRRRAEPPPAPPTKDPMSIQKLLKRFGIK